MYPLWNRNEPALIISKSSIEYKLAQPDRFEFKDIKSIDLESNSDIFGTHIKIKLEKNINGRHNGLSNMKHFYRINNKNEIFWYIP